MNRYIVTLANVDVVEDFLNTIRTDNTTDTDNLIPTRAVSISNPMELSLKSTEFFLTQEEASLLRSHKDVKAVEVFTFNTYDIFAEQRDIFWRNGTSVLDGYFTNWGLFSTSRKDPLAYIEGETDIFDPLRVYDISTGVKYPYALDGTGVDVVIQDNGVMTGHPEWEDADGNTRLMEIDWYAETGSSGAMSSSHYGDVGYHGTHVASIAAGKRHGYAKNARIYSIRFDSAGGIGTIDCFNLIRLWHEQKPIDPNTGYKRPTIVNASWGYGWYVPGYIDSNSLTDVVFRGTSTGTTSLNGSNYRSLGFGPSVRHEASNIAVNEACQDMIDAGVVFVNAGGNSGYKHDLPGGIDYDNHYTSSGDWIDIPAGDPIYYNRPGSPWSADGISVANYSNTGINVFGASLGEVLTRSSVRGPANDIAAPGTRIWAATNNADMLALDPNRTFSASYFGNNAYNNLCITGTSMAAPQVTGILALYLQINPTATSAQCKKWLLEFASVNKYQVETEDRDNTSDPNYFDDSSFQGMAKKFLINPFSEKYTTKLNDTKEEYGYGFVVSSFTVDEVESPTTTITVQARQDLPESKRTVSYEILGDGITQDDVDVPLTGNMTFSLNSDNIWESTLTITVTNDELTEGTERLLFRIDSGDTALITIEDTSNRTPGIIITPDLNNPSRDGDVIYEGESLSYAVRGNGYIPTNDTYTFYVRMDGNINNSDFYAFANYQSGIPYSVSAGEEIEINFGFVADYVSESPKTFEIIFEERDGDGNVTQLYRTVHVLEDRPSINWTFEIEPENAFDEGGPGSVYEQTAVVIKATPEDITLAPPGTPVWITQTSGSAYEGSDYQPLGQQEFTVGTIGYAGASMYIFNDAQTEAPEFFYLRLYDSPVTTSANLKGEIQVKIYDRPPVEYNVAVTGTQPVDPNPELYENPFYEGSSFTVTLTPSYVYNLPSQIYYTLSGNAVLNSDFFGLQNSGAIGRNSNDEYVIGGGIATDSNTEGPETIQILFYKESYLATNIGRAVITIVDNP